MSDAPERIVITPDAASPLKLPDDLRAEWQDKLILRETAYTRTDLYLVAVAERDALAAELATSNEIGRAFEEDAGQQRERAESAEAKVGGLSQMLRQMIDDPDYWTPYARAALRDSHAPRDGV